MYGESICELNLHGMTVTQAQTAINAALRKAGCSLYRIRIIHGYNNGTALRDMIRKNYQKHPKVKRIEIGMNQGVTELVLREF